MGTKSFGQDRDGRGALVLARRVVRFARRRLGVPSVIRQRITLAASRQSSVIDTMKARAELRVHNGLRPAERQGKHQERVSAASEGLTL